MLKYENIKILMILKTSNAYMCVYVCKCIYILYFYIYRYILLNFNKLPYIF